MVKRPLGGYIKVSVGVNASMLLLFLKKMLPIGGVIRDSGLLSGEVLGGKASYML